MLKFYLVEAAIRRALPPGRVCQLILRNHGYAIDFRTTSFTGSISGALRISRQPLRSNNYIIVSLKSTGAFKAIRVDPRDMQSLRLLRQVRDRTWIGSSTGSGSDLVSDQYAISPMILTPLIDQVATLPVLTRSRHVYF